MNATFGLNQVATDTLQAVIGVEVLNQQVWADLPTSITVNVDQLHGYLTNRPAWFANRPTGSILTTLAPANQSGSVTVQSSNLNAMIDNSLNLHISGSVSLQGTLNNIIGVTLLQAYTPPIPIGFPPILNFNGSFQTQLSLGLAIQGTWNFANATDPSGNYEPGGPILTGSSVTVTPQANITLTGLGQFDYGAISAGLKGKFGLQLPFQASWSNQSPNWALTLPNFALDPASKYLTGSASLDLSELYGIADQKWTFWQFPGVVPNVTLSRPPTSIPYDGTTDVLNWVHADVNGSLPVGPPTGTPTYLQLCREF